MGIKGVLLASSIAVTAVSPAWAINKCTGPDGKVAFQDAPCTGSGKSETLNVKPASGRGSLQEAAPVQVPSKQPSPESAATAPPATQPTSAPTPVAKSPLDAEAEMCLAWYRPLLRDPQGAYYTNVAKEKRVLSIDVHATNGYGGYVIKRGACEIYNGKLNDAWTKNHAKWGGWPAE